MLSIYRIVRHRYEEAVRSECRRRKSAALRVEAAFAHICNLFREGEFSDLLQGQYGADWLQAVAGILGMLMHLSLTGPRSCVLHNGRRPGKPFSSYPTPPAVAVLAAEYVVAHTLNSTAPAVIDPAMESGQLLLAVAEAVLRRVEGPRRRAVLDKLCRDCLWGIDRNPLATESVSLIFQLLGGDPPRHLLIEDSLRWQAVNPRKFDAVISNPPWGERMTSLEREWLRDEFSNRRRGDTYIAFTELATRILAPGGVYALVLPAQALASENASGLRGMISAQTHLTTAYVLPRHAFATATVRACLLRGVLREPDPTAACRAVVYPFRKALSHKEPPSSTQIPLSVLCAVGADSWWPLLQGHQARPFAGETVPLETVAAVHLGVQVYAVGRGRPPQTRRVVQQRPYTSDAPVAGWTPAVQVRDVTRFHVAPPHRYINFGKWLASSLRSGDLLKRRRVLVRELCRRDGTMTAAVTANGSIAVHGVFSLVPRRISAHALAAVLNSPSVAEYVRGHAASFAKVDFQRVTTAELRRLPIPVAAMQGPRARRLAALARRAQYLRVKTGGVPDTLTDRIEWLVREMYDGIDGSKH